MWASLKKMEFLSIISQIIIQFVTIVLYLIRKNGKEKVVRSSVPKSGRVARRTHDGLSIRPPACGSGECGSVSADGSPGRAVLSP